MTGCLLARGHAEHHVLRSRAEPMHAGPSASSQSADSNRLLVLREARPADCRPPVGRPGRSKIRRSMVLTSQRPAAAKPSCDAEGGTPPDAPSWQTTFRSSVRGRAVAPVSLAQFERFRTSAASSRLSAVTAAKLMLRRPRFFGLRVPRRQRPAPPGAQGRQRAQQEQASARRSQTILSANSRNV